MSEKDEIQPLVRLQDGGKAAILSYNVPEPTSYPGHGYLELGLDDEWFAPETKQGKTFKQWEEEREKAETPSEDPGSSTDVGVGGSPGTVVRPPTVIRRDHRVPVSRGSTVVRDHRTRTAPPRVGTSPPRPRSSGSDEPDRMRPDGGTATTVPTEAEATETDPAPAVEESFFDPVEITARAREGYRPLLYYTMGQNLRATYVSTPTELVPRLMLLERYRLSSYLGNYGAGRTIKTFSLLPGERTRISVKTFRESEEKRREASSILDSYTSSTAEEFQESLASEQTHRESFEESLQWHVEAKASAGWGWGKASVEAGAKGATNAAREEFAKNVAETTSKHAAEASSKRDVEIETSYERTTKEGEETAIEREVENINLSRTLNFVFRQMNQEYITLLHLEDVRVAFANGGVDDEGVPIYREVALSELDSLLADVIVEDERETVKDLIEGELSTILNYAGEERSLVERATVENDSGGVVREYLHVKKDDPDAYVDETGNEITVPGVILSARKHVMRTDGVVVEALLGQSNGLDDYSVGLQTQAVRAREIENERLEAEIERLKLAVEVVRDGDDAAVERYERVFGRGPDDEADADVAVEGRTVAPGGR